MIDKNLLQKNMPDASTPPNASSHHAMALRLAVILTCFNRKQHTLECLHALAASTGMEQVQVSAVLVDDGSKDGTAEAVRELFPWVDVTVADGNLFWCRGMHKAFAIAMQNNPDYYLWLNDDTTLNEDALTRLLKCAQDLRVSGQWPVIVVGSTIDEQTGKLTYGGDRRAARWRPMSFVKVRAVDRPEVCESMNGNIVLIPSEAAQIVGNLDPRFEHAMGDIDYALRATQLGVGVWVAPGVHGMCSHNPVTGTFLDGALPLGKRLRLILGRKGLPWRSWLILTRRHAGILWPGYFVWPYIRTVLVRPKSHG